MVCIFCLSLFFAGSLAGGPLRTSDIPADAKWAAHFDMNALVASRIGQLIMGEMESKGEMQKIDAFGKLFDFNPIRDLHSVTAFSKTFNEEEGLIVVRGRLDREKVKALMETHCQCTEMVYGDFKIFRCIAPDKQFHYCFFRSDTLLISSDIELVKEELDILSGSKASLESGGNLQMLNSLPSGTFFAAAARGFGNLADRHPNARILQKAESLAIFFGECEGVDFLNIKLSARDEKTAGQVYNIVQGIIALGMMLGDEQPKLAKLAGSMKVEQAGCLVTLRETMQADELFEFLKKQD